MRNSGHITLCIYAGPAAGTQSGQASSVIGAGADVPMSTVPVAGADTGNPQVCIMTSHQATHLYATSQDLLLSHGLMRMQVNVVSYSAPDSVGCRGCSLVRRVHMCCTGMFESWWLHTSMDSAWYKDCTSVVLTLREHVMCVQKPSAQDKARSKTAVLAAGVQEDLAKLREKLTIKNVSPFYSAHRFPCTDSSHVLGMTICNCALPLRAASQLCLPMSLAASMLQGSVMHSRVTACVMR